MKQEEKVLTRDVVIRLGLDKVDVITSDMIEGYTSIEDDTFWGCTSLTSITIPNSVNSIGEYAFSNCSVLTSVSFGNSVTSIGNYAFSCCISLTSIIFHNSVTNIGANAFYYCLSLTSITLPNSVTSIGDYAFDCCSSITSIIIPNNIIRIGMCAFYKNNKLKNVVIRDRTYKAQEVINGKCKAYKAFKVNLTCRGFKYEEGKTYEIKDEPKMCVCGFHACLNIFDVFNYYYGEIGKDIVVHEVKLEGVSNETTLYDSKVVAKKITIGKRIL